MAALGHMLDPFLPLRIDRCPLQQLFHLLQRDRGQSKSIVPT